MTLHTLRWIHRHYPSDPLSLRSAEAAEFAAAQGRFWEFADALFEAHESVKTPHDLLRVAGEIGLMQFDLSSALTSHQYREQINQQKHEADKLNIRVLPTFFINGQRYEGNMSRDSIESLVASRLEVADFDECCTD